PARARLPPRRPAPPRPPRPRRARARAARALAGDDDPPDLEHARLEPRAGGRAPRRGRLDAQGPEARAAARGRPPGDRRESLSGASVVARRRAEDDPLQL